MNKQLQTYLEIYEQFPLNRHYTKEERKERYNKLCYFEKLPVSSLPTLDELMQFLQKYKDIISILPQFVKKFEVVCEQDLLNGYKFAECLFEQDMFEEWMGTSDISSMQVVNQVLVHNPNHSKALIFKLKMLIRYHDYSIHELPLGVLAQGPLKEELDSIQEMEDIAQKLSFKHETFEKLLTICRMIYPLWFEYLQDKQAISKGFKAFLIQEGIDINDIKVPYINL